MYLERSAKSLKASQTSSHVNRDWFDSSLSVLFRKIPAFASCCSFVWFCSKDVTLCAFLMSMADRAGFKRYFTHI